eukprot:GFYU01010307.1.p1 GENE.GFYU01010307.1~~GFYU01010307.1.p1  ORF type:complete len:752 (-),score=246.86 GFYU01010307.1:90-2345(-)
MAASKRRRAGPATPLATKKKVELPGVAPQQGTSSPENAVIKSSLNETPVVQTSPATTATITQGDVDETFVVSKEMLEEEERLEHEREVEDEQKLKTQNVNEYDNAVNKQRLDRLKFLLDKTSIYSHFLAQKISHPEMEQDNAKPEVVEKSAKKMKNAEGDAVPTEEDLSHIQPALLTGGKLRNYQLKGLQWLISLYENGLNGILADEMGLGKTIQTISFLAHLRSHGVWGPHLIVGPLSTLPNWVNEFHRFAPDIPVILYHGDKAAREQLRMSRMRLMNESFPVIVTSYEIIIRDRKFLQRYKWKYIVVDEGHRIKNMNCRLIRELKQCQSANRLLLTGTPLQNHLTELWSLLNFLLPDVFENLADFENWFNFSDIGDEDRQKHIIQKEQEELIVSKLHQILQPFLLRRVKSEVEHSIPSKKEIIVYTHLEPIQHEYYKATLENNLRSLLAEKNVKNSGSQRLMNVLMQLRKCCNHPYLFYDPDEEAAQKGGHVVTDEKLVECCGKLKMLDRLLKQLKKRGHRVLIFSQMARMLDILEDYMMLRGWGYCRLDGSTAWEDRKSQLNDFTNDNGDELFCFLLTTRAGGLGINLTAADTVILYDSDWNPHADSQASDRCHRIGQQKPVIVYRLITGNSVEVKMLEKANEKRKLEKLVIGHGNFKGGRSLNAPAKKSGDKTKELLALLKSSEADAELDLGTAGIMSDAELERLLDRSDMDGAGESKGTKGKDEGKGRGYEILDGSGPGNYLDNVM